MRNTLIDCYFFRCQIWICKQQALTRRGEGGGALVGKAPWWWLLNLSQVLLKTFKTHFHPNVLHRLYITIICLTALMLPSVKSVNELVIKRYLFFIFVFLAPLSWKIHEWSRRTFLYQIWWRVCLALQRMDGNKTRKDSPPEPSSRSDSG